MQPSSPGAATIRCRAQTYCRGGYDPVRDRARVDRVVPHVGTAGEITMPSAASMKSGPGIRVLIPRLDRSLHPSENPETFARSTASLGPGGPDGSPLSA